MLKHMDTAALRAECQALEDAQQLEASQWRSRGGAGNPYADSTLMRVLGKARSDAREAALVAAAGGQTLVDKLAGSLRETADFTEASEGDEGLVVLGAATVSRDVEAWSPALARAFDDFYGNASRLSLAEMNELSATAKARVGKTRALFALARSSSTILAAACSRATTQAEAVSILRDDDRLPWNHPGARWLKEQVV